jgi:Flavin-binding monooxygenase-like
MTKPKATDIPLAQSIVVIGCGPGGMFFCNAMEHRKRHLAGDDAQLPTITCYERASGPGGVWRSERSFCYDAAAEEEKKHPDVAEAEQLIPNMYEALWTNGVKEGIEFFDHTYDEHFGHALPVYMPRRALLDYMVTRVTKNCPDFFEKYVQFNTTVQSVVWKEEMQKFQVVVSKHGNKSPQTHYYDKCIWSAGDNGKAKIPQAMKDTFANFTGRVIHSTDTSNFYDDVEGKRILIVGGSYSAEDLALMACKVDAEKVYISTRQSTNVVTWTSAWPRNKVEILAEVTPVRVVENRIQFKSCHWVSGSEYKTESDVLQELSDIDTVILCTGYEKQFDMLEPSLRAPFDKGGDDLLVVPEDWKMKPNNLGLGDVKPSEKTSFRGSYVSYPGIYHGLLIDNPNMMYLRHNHSDYPLLGIDAMAFMLLNFVVGETPIPSKEQMNNANIQQALIEMQYPYARYYMDPAFKEAWSEVPGAWDDYETNSEHPYWVSEADYEKYDLLLMARTLRDAKYPVDLGDYQALNEKGQHLYNFQKWSGEHRSKLDPNNPEENYWRTFRDVDNSDKFFSIFTGTKAVPLKQRWMDIDESKNDVLTP